MMWAFALNFWRMGKEGATECSTKRKNAGESHIDPSTNQVFIAHAEAQFD